MAVDFIARALINKLSKPEYAVFRDASTAVAITTADTVIPLDTVVTGNISLASNRFTLKANKTYRLTAHIPYNSNATANILYQFYNVTGSAYLAGANGMANFGSAPQDSTVDIIFTPSVNTVIELRVRTVTAGGYTSTSGDVPNVGAQVIVQQIC
jgi:hypothetical protein